MEKIANNKWWKPVFDRGGLELCTKSGWFDDLSDWSVENSVQTPIPLPTNLKLGKTAVVLLTGGLCPIHSGHIQAMIAAETKLINLGYQNIVCYFSPGHQDYIKHKKGNDVLSEADRLLAVSNVLKDKNNWYLSQYEILQQYSLNYTEVLEWHQWYYKQNNIEVDWFFLAGGDNSSFYQPFIDTNVGFICVSRPGTTIDPEFITKLGDKNKFYWLKGDNPHSSTELLSSGWQRPSYANTAIIRIRNRNLSLPEIFLLQTIKTKFNWNVVVSAEEQAESIKQNNYNLVTLDFFTNSPDYQKLEISRLYQPFGHHKIGYINRPGTQSISEQIENLRPDIDIIHDDDIHTGSTINFITNLLKNSNKLAKHYQVQSYTKSRFNEEIIDLNDFLLKYDSGLVVKIGGNECRAPYIWPFVCPAARASILDPREFSQNIWTVLSRAYSNHTVQTLNYQLFNLLGWPKESKISDICSYYASILKNKNG